MEKIAAAIQCIGVIYPPRVQLMAKHEYHEGPKAREAFDKGMAKLFQVMKEAVNKSSVSKPKRKKASKA
jgi:hypothetical protein